MSAYGLNTVYTNVHIYTFLRYNNEYLFIHVSYKCSLIITAWDTSLKVMLKLYRYVIYRSNTCVIHIWSAIYN